MRRYRVIPVLLIRGKGVYKTIKFSKPNYIGDPVNIIKLFNDKGVDEITVLDIDATREKRSPNSRLIEELASECFMPMAYGGGIQSLDEASKIFSLGVEKIVINSAFSENPELVSDIAARYGSQSVVVSMDVKNTIFKGKQVATQNGNKNTGIAPLAYAKRAQEAGAGEILLNSIDRDGTISGYDNELIAEISSCLSIPVIACGGAKDLNSLWEGLNRGASAVAAGSMFVYKGGPKSILVNYPSRDELTGIFSNINTGK